MSEKSRKPTEPYGYIAFSKNGKVKKQMFQLSHDKEEQEVGVIEHFLKALPSKDPDLNIIGHEQLPEADQDFVLRCDEGEIYVQVTEIVEREYAFPISKAEYNAGHYSHFIQKKPGEIPWAVDIGRRDASIKRAIERKINKHYAKSANQILWLLIFCTSSCLTTEFWEGGQKRMSKSLTSAHEYLRTLNRMVFDQIWYTNLLTSPVRIWPQ